MLLFFPPRGRLSPGREVPLQDQPALLGMRGGDSRFMLPLGSPEFPRPPIRGRLTGVGTSGWTDSMEAGLTGMGVRMGADGMTGIEDRPTDRFGMEPIPGWGEDEEGGGGHTDEDIRNLLFFSAGSFYSLKQESHRHQALLCLLMSQCSRFFLTEINSKKSYYCVKSGL